MSSAGDPDLKSQPPPLPPGRGGAPRLSAVPTSADPFAEPADPRPPRGGAADEKLEYFRSLVKSRDETLSRARSMYGELQAELQPLRAAAAGLRAQCETLGHQLTLAQAEASRVPAFLEMLESRQQEVRRLEKVAARQPDLEARLREALRVAGRLEQELAAEREAGRDYRAQAERSKGELERSQALLSSTQARVERLTGEKRELEADLDAVQEQYRSVAADSEATAQRVAQLEAELEQAHAATSDAKHFQGEARTLAARCRELEGALTESVRKVNALESEQEWSKSTLEAAEERAQALEEERAALVASMEGQHAQWTARAQEAVRAEQSARAELSEERGRVEALEAALGAEQARVDELNAQLEELLGADDPREALEGEVAALKKKLIHAEAAIEAATILKRKVAKLEGMLKAK